VHTRATQMTQANHATPFLGDTGHGAEDVGDPRVEQQLDDTRNAAPVTDLDSGSSVTHNTTDKSVAAHPKTRLQSGIRKNKLYTDRTVRYGCFTSTGEPQNLEEALDDKNWRHAMDIEYSALMNNKTWRLVPHNQGKNIIDWKWVYKIKKKANRSIDRFTSTGEPQNLEEALDDKNWRQAMGV
jgi:hypothetical protein